MRTADTIAQQAEANSAERPRFTTKAGRNAMHPNSLKNLQPPWKKGECPSPGRKHKHDVAAAFARAVIEGTVDQAFQGFARQLANGNAYTFKELAERGYGPMKQHIQFTANDRVMEMLTEGRKRVAERKKG
jgi:hypothetical protein